ncbi:MAG: AmmeMemoRadiSam system radical SAM enzyme [Eubacteriales bacterium]
MNSVSCGICPHRCNLKEGQTGLCRARSNRGGQIRCDNYGLVTSLALDPIEKKPLHRFFPGSTILSAGSFGCNMHCPFCQNFEISMADINTSAYTSISPEKLISQAVSLKSKDNIGVAFTYNEPFVGYEYVWDSSVLAHKNDLKTVLVTNGYVNEEPLLRLLPYIDAMNIDLKTFSGEYYRLLGGNLEDVKRTISLSSLACHVEVTTLIVPGQNDTDEEMRSLSAWLASVNPDIPLHISRFFPRYKMLDRPATNIKTVYHLAGIARDALHFVYEGNC